ncbi:hypothetical protein [Candidatus Chlorohelix sp.]|uniref:hypothetical protein n=1 Tax=Candidatus Chlorohelix sp. TaxID=3139201 RepID=UPI00303888EF
MRVNSFSIKRLLILTLLIMVLGILAVFVFLTPVVAGNNALFQATTTTAAPTPTPLPPTPTPLPTPTPKPENPKTEGGGPPGILILAGIFLLLVILSVTVPFMRTRSKR